MTTPPCAMCSRSSTSGSSLCFRCRKGIDRERGDCAGCGKPDRLLDQRLHCLWCRDKDFKRCADCHEVGAALVSFEDDRVCHRCGLRRHLDQIIPTEPAGALHRLRENILIAEPLTTRRWLVRTGDLLKDLDTGRLPLTHETLDRLPKRKAAEHLRALLTSADILGPDPGRALRHLENALPDHLSVLTPENRKIVDRWINWTVLPPLRAVPDPQKLSTAVNNARRKIEQTAEFLRTLQRAERTLGQCSQYDIDAWFAGPGAARRTATPFLKWAQHQRELSRELTLRTHYTPTPETPADSEERWQVAQRLVHDDTLDPVDRIAGALVVLYAQPLIRIVSLTTDDVIVTDTNVQLKLGTDALELPEPFASEIQRLPHRRRASTAEQLPTRWLFTGSHADKPLSAASLGNRLRTIGIQPRRFRIAAAEQLTRDIPPAMLVGILGLPITAINRHTARTQGQWAHYAADRTQ